MPSASAVSSFVIPTKNLCFTISALRDARVPGKPQGHCKHRLHECDEENAEYCPLKVNASEAGLAAFESSNCRVSLDRFDCSRLICQLG